jgi:hypothetical protein
MSEFTQPASAPFLELTPKEHQRQLRHAVIASTVGTTIEWYDFLLYSVVTGLVFGKLFFPHSDPLVGVLEGSVASLCCPSGQVQVMAWQDSDGSHRCGGIRPSKGGNSPLR